MGGSYACIYGSKINGDINQPSTDRENTVQSASGRWKADICNKTSQELRMQSHVFIEDGSMD